MPYSWRSALLSYAVMLSRNFAAAQSNAFQGAASVIVLRVGRGGASTLTGASASAYAVPLFLDEYCAGGGATAPLQSISLPTAAAAGQLACTLSWGTSTAIFPNGNWNYDMDGMLSTSADGAAVIFPCFDQAPGATLTMATIVPKPIAVLNANGTIDTTRSVSEYNSNTMRTDKLNLVQVRCASPGSRYRGARLSPHDNHVHALRTRHAGRIGVRRLGLLYVWLRLSLPLIRRVLSTVKRRHFRNARQPG